MLTSAFRSVSHTTLAMLLAATLLGTAHAADTTQPTEAEAAAKKALESATPVDVTMEYGKADAPVLIEEYASLSCSHCADFHKKDLQPLLKSHIATGKARLVMHSYIRNEPDLRGTMLLGCLKDNDERKQYAGVMFEMQEQWAFNENVVSALGDLVKVGGFDAKAFETCMADKKLETGLLKNLQVTGETREIKGTPSFFVNGTRYEGAPTAAQLGKFIDNQPAQAPAASNAAK